LSVVCLGYGQQDCPFFSAQCEMGVRLLTKQKQQVKSAEVAGSIGRCLPLVIALATRARATGALSEPSRCHGVLVCLSFSCATASSWLCSGTVSSRLTSNFLPFASWRECNENGRDVRESVWLGILEARAVVKGSVKECPVLTMGRRPALRKASRVVEDVRPAIEVDQPCQRRQQRRKIDYM
jgi:hypothetical protein